MEPPRRRLQEGKRRMRNDQNHHRKLWNPARSSTIRLSSNGMTTSMGEPTLENVLKGLEDLVGRLR